MHTIYLGSSDTTAFVGSTQAFRAAIDMLKTLAIRYPAHKIKIKALTSVCHRDRSSRDHPLPKLSKEVLTLIHVMYTGGESDASKKFDPTSALEYLEGYGTQTHAATYAHFVGCGEMVDPTLTADGEPLFRPVELPTRKQIKGYFGGKATLAAHATKADSLNALRAVPPLYPAKQDDPKCYWTVQFDDGDMKGLTGRELRHERPSAACRRGRPCLRALGPRRHPPARDRRVQRQALRRLGGRLHERRDQVDPGQVDPGQR